MLTALSNGISKFFSDGTSPSQLGHQSKYKINLNTTQLKHELERVAKLYDGAQEKYNKLNNKHRFKRDVTTSVPDTKIDQVYQNIVQALENNVNNQTLSSLDVEGLSAEELKADEYSYQLFRRVINGDKPKEMKIQGIGLLIAKGADVNAISNKYGTSILHVAASKGNSEIIKYLVDELNMDVNFKNKKGVTPLHYSKCPECTTFLLSKGAGINVQDNQGFTPLHYALTYPIDTFKALVNAGAEC